MSTTHLEGRAGSLHLIGGALALDFANTASGRGSDRHLDHLRTAEDVVAWAAHAGVIDAAVAGRLRSRLAQSDETLTSLLPEALALRAAVHGVGSAIADGATPAQADIEGLHKAVARAVANAKLAPGEGGGYRWIFDAENPSIDVVLGPVALSAVGLLRDSDLTRIKRCRGGEHCGWLFFDLTKNNSRRWCDMKVCGNRTKARTHRRKQMKAEEIA